MKHQPLRRYRTPGYPTKLQVLARRELLEKHWPEAWARNVGIASVAAAMLAAGGCGRTESGVAVVAPIFEHGDGRGATGCVAVAPPAFLSEEEALQVIAEELAQAGVDVTRRNVPLAGVRIKQYDVSKPSAKGQLPEKVETLRVDGIAEDVPVAVEFVSSADYFRFGGTPSNSTAQSFEFKMVAQTLRDRVAKRRSHAYIGTFYDPCSSIQYQESEGADPQERWERAMQVAKEESMQLLREQVADFVNWLKAQGAI